MAEICTLIAEQHRRKILRQSALPGLTSPYAMRQIRCAAECLKTTSSLRTPARRPINVVLWQFLLEGKKPTHLIAPHRIALREKALREPYPKEFGNQCPKLRTVDPDTGYLVECDVISGPE